MQAHIEMYSISLARKFNYEIEAPASIGVNASIGMNAVFRICTLG